MAFCPECGKAATAEATRCVHCGHEFDAKLAASKPGSRFKGTMMMAATAAAKPAANAQTAASVASREAASVIATAPTPVAPAPVAAAQPVARNAQAKATMIGSGIGASFGAPSAQGRAAAAQAPGFDAARRNVAHAQTQLGAAFTAPATAAPAAAAPVRAAAVAAVAAPAAVVAAPESVVRERGEPSVWDESESESAAAPKYLPGDPMAPQPTAARSPVLRYDDSMPGLPRRNPLEDRRWLWIATGVIVLVCLGLVFVLAAKLSR